MDRLNDRVLRLAAELASRAAELRVAVREIDGGGRVIDCGIEARGGLAAGLLVARTCLADLADVSIVPGEVGDTPVPLVQVSTDHPVAACLASQYAGWSIQLDDFFAMGSGPMRAAYGREELFETIGHVERPAAVAGILETRSMPDARVFDFVASKTGVGRDAVTLLAAPTASIVGGVQVVARSVETALHKLHELRFDLTRVVSGHGTAPLPPVARKDIEAIGRTNDCVLYGGRVTLWVTGDDASLEEIGPRVPSSSSPDHGEPFAEIFARHGNDFYKIDPGLFSPAEIVFQNLDTGRTRRFGGTAPSVLARSLFA